jgi:hypothetical protein
MMTKRIPCWIADCICFATAKSTRFFDTIAIPTLQREEMLEAIVINISCNKKGLILE